MSSPQDLTPTERFDRYVMLQRQQSTTEKQIEELKVLIKQDLDNGHVLQNETHYAQARKSSTVSYDTELFAQTFGPEILRRVCSVEKGKVDKLAETGELDQLLLLSIQTIKLRSPALIIQKRIQE